LKTTIQICTFLLILVGCANPPKKTTLDSQKKNNYAVIIKLGLENDKISSDWKDALTNRLSKKNLDSISKVKKPLTLQENDWYQLIKSRANKWVLFRDSLQVPFSDRKVNDTTYVLLGNQGGDDAFSYQHQTVCFNLTALHRAYGSANKTVNTNRIDRIFSHEYTHLLSKEWVKHTAIKLQTFKDRILWECMYEGVGMYRSMSAKWFPKGDTLSEMSSKTFETLYPIFAERLITIETSKNLSEEDKTRLHKNLSRGSMKKKWGALPVAVWLAMEANGDDKNLIPWINMGPNAIIPLAKKYLTGEDKIRFVKTFAETSISSIIEK
jgi:hypothetical protein